MKQTILGLSACLALALLGSGLAHAQASPEPPQAGATNDANFSRDVVEPSFTKTVVVFFHFQACAPCARVWPQYMEAAERGTIAVVKVGVEKSFGLATKHGIRSVPVTVAYRDGKPIKTLQGANDAT
jgi:thioredoxin 1